MKKVLFGIVAVTIALASCKKEDGNGNNSDDVIVGTWKLVSKTENGEVFTDSCGLAEGKYEFSADGTGRISGANTNSLSGNGECRSFSYNITWSKTSENNYKVVAGSITREWTTEFSNSNNRLVITQYEEEDNETDISTWDRQ